MNPENDFAVIVLSMFDTGLYAVRALCRQGIQVFGLDYDQRKTGYRSRYGKNILCENPLLSNDIIQNIKRIAENYSKILLIPASDEFLNYLLINKETIPKNCITIQPAEEVLKMILDKQKQLNYVKSLGFNVPSFCETSTEKLEEVITNITYPVFIKPAKIHEWKKIFKNKGIKLQSLEEAKKKLPLLITHQQEVLLQEIVPGSVNNNFEASFYYDRAGRFRQKFIIQKIRQWPLEFGSATSTRTVKNKVVEKLSRNLLEAMSWHGFANVEFKFDPRVNEYQFIEINARVWQQIGHAEALGINFPTLCYLDCINQLNSQEHPYPLNSYWIDANSDFVAVYNLLKKEPKQIKELFRSYLYANNLGLLSFDDLKPFLYSLGVIK